MREEHETVRKLADRIRDVVDSVLGTLDALIHPAPAPIPVRSRRPQRPVRRRR